jgi:hypothetical protein
MAEQFIVPIKIPVRESDHKGTVKSDQSQRTLHLWRNGLVLNESHHTETDLDSGQWSSCQWISYNIDRSNTLKSIVTNSSDCEIRGAHSRSLLLSLLLLRQVTGERQGLAVCYISI